MIQRVCIQTKVSQPRPHLSKIFGHLLNDKAVKTNSVLVSQFYTHSDLLFLTAQLTVFVLTKHCRHTLQNFSQPASYAQVTTSSEVFEFINPEIEPKQ